MHLLTTLQSHLDCLGSEPPLVTSSALQCVAGQGEGSPHTLVLDFALYGQLGGC